MTYRIIISDSALSRIADQARYIAIQEEAPEVARLWLCRVLAAADSLETFPRRCPRAEEDFVAPMEVRALDIDGFLLLYTIDDEQCVVRVLGARHGRQRAHPHRLSEE